MSILIPPYLHAGDTIAIVCPSGYLPLEKTLQAKKVLESWGFNVILGATTKSEYHYFSAPDALRLLDIQNVLDNVNVKAVLMGRGGYGMSRIIDDINFDIFLQHPKWIIGFSDITVLHSHINKNFGIASMHAPMCGAFENEYLSNEYMLLYQDILKGAYINYKFTSHSYNVLGSVSAPIVGGNLCMLDHLSGSVSAIDTVDKILFIEDIGEHLYKIDRMLYNLKRSGKLAQIKGLICGNFSDMEDTIRPFGKNIYEIILEHVEHLDIPVAFDVPIGHERINYPLILGTSYDFIVNEHEVVIKQIENR